ncbi:MAG: ECF transporter S component [Prevotella sp.]|nr:ECF transporter S component [Prevotella sp.]
METSIRLYSLSYSEIRTYMMAALFVVCNIALPQLFHLIPQGGIIFAPLSLVIMAGAYKFGWRAALLAAVLSPIVNHAISGLPAASVMTMMIVKLSLLALVAGLAAQHFKSVSLYVLVAVALLTEACGFLAEFAITGGVAASVADFTIGWPGLLLQVFGTFAILKLWKS